MALAPHRRRLLLLPLLSRSLPSSLSFSTTSRSSLPSSNPGPSTRAAIAAQTTAAQSSGAVLDHVGLLDSTFIMPHHPPSLLLKPLPRLRLEFSRLRTRAIQLFQSFVCTKFMLSPRLPIFTDRSAATKFAKQIFEEINTSLAAGGLHGKLLSEGGRLANGLEGNVKARIGRGGGGAIGGGEGREWRVEKWVERPRVVSWRFMVLPKVKGVEQGRSERHGIVQCVVKLRARQSLVRTRKVRRSRAVTQKSEGGEGGVGRKRGERGVGRSRKMEEEGDGVEWRTVVVDANGREIETEEGVRAERKRVERETVEYWVVQRLLKRGKLSPWMAWGTAEETTVQKLRDEANPQAVQQQQQHTAG